MIWMQNNYAWLNLVIFTIAWIYITFIVKDNAHHGGMVSFNFYDMLRILSFVFLILAAIAAFLQLKFPWALFLAYGLAGVAVIANVLCLLSSRWHHSYFFTLIFCLCLNTIISVIRAFRNVWCGELVVVNEQVLRLFKELKATTGDSKFVLHHFTDWTRGEQARILRTFCGGCGFPSIKFHTLRACWATQLIRDRVAPVHIRAKRRIDRIKIYS